MYTFPFEICSLTMVRYFGGSFSAAACAKVHLYAHRSSFGCWFTLHILQHLLQASFVLNRQPIPFWKGKI